MLNSFAGRARSPLAEALLWWAVAFSPFTQALTLDVGFPLKATEVLGILAILALALEARLFTRERLAGKYPLAALVGLTLLSTTFALLSDSPDPSGTGYDRGLVLDIAQYTFYALLVVGLCWAISNRLGFGRATHALMVATRLAAAYVVVQASMHLAGESKILAAICGTAQIGRAYGVPFPRNGPFLEGNYLGLFAGVALFVAWNRRDKLGIVLGFGLLMYSQSTSGLIAASVALLAATLARPTGKVVSALAVAALVALGAVAVIPQASQYIGSQASKLGLQEASSDIYGTSRVERARSSLIGFTMAADHPVLGVGPGRYGVWANTVEGEDGMPIHQQSTKWRPIANNGYAQIASELGIPALAAMVALLITTAVKTRRRAPKLHGLVVFIATAFITAPAWTMIPVWVGLAIPLSALADDRRKRLAADGVKANPMATVGRFESV